MTTASPNRLRKAPSRFTTVPNALLRDAELSLKAKGLYCLMYSKPDDWTFYESALVKESKDQKDAVRAGLQELLDRGWLKRERSKTETGQFAAYEYEICTESNQSGLSAPAKPPRENRSGKPASSNTEKENTETDTPLPPTGVSGVFGMMILNSWNC
ncbi:hypothetical protein [Methylobacterium aquaticum]|uniref:hypothetical protein n=1 Tax=Methylobacterium aquaticum TaxID=270351 RepID=UPI00193139AD|nr:hypothetical protein [Methylobacterium aquaticum]QRE76993.1 hypothetical protein F1D61_28665 [Methylobacterium aquaticum]